MRKTQDTKVEMELKMRNIKLTIEYDGTNYHGWQSQINAKSIQDEITLAINKLTGEDCKLIGASRTDLGVHAFGQIANFMTASTIPTEKFAFALNTILARDISVKMSEEVSLDFHSRYSSIGKKYKYIIYNSRQPSALMRNRAWHIHQKLDMSDMLNASKFFIGTHDFSAFKAAGSSTKSSVRTISDISLVSNDELIQIEVIGDGFLYNMVRIIAGTLVYVGLQKIDYNDITSIIESKDRKKSGKTAPAQGLYLVEVYY